MRTKHDSDAAFDDWRNPDNDDPMARAAFRGGWEAGRQAHLADVTREVEQSTQRWQALTATRLAAEDEYERRIEVAESVVQMAAHDRDEALENFANAEKEIERLEGLLTRIHDIAKNGLEGRDDYEAMREIEMLSGTTNRPAHRAAWDGVGVWGNGGEG